MLKGDPPPGGHDHWGRLRDEVLRLDVGAGADGVYRRALEILRHAEPSGRELLAIDALRVAGEAALELGRIEHSCWLLTQAVDRAVALETHRSGKNGTDSEDRYDREDQRRALGDALLLRSFAQMRHGDLDGAIDDARRAGEVVTDDRRGRALMLAATAHLHRDENELAASLLAQALAACELGGDQHTAAKVLNNMGLMAAVDGRLSDADELFEQALAAFADQGDEANVLRARYNRVLNWSAMGRHAEALALIDQLRLRLCEIGVDEGVLDLDRARVLFRAGLVSEATSCALSAANRLSTGDAGLETAEVLFELSRTRFLLGDHQQAVQLGRQAAPLFAAQGRLMFERRVCALVSAARVIAGAKCGAELDDLDADLAVSAAAVLLDADRHPEARRMLARIELGDDDPSRAVALGLLALADGRFCDVRDAVESAFAAILESPNHPALHEACSSRLDRMSALVSAGIRAELALDRVEAALALLERWRQLVIDMASALGDRTEAGLPARWQTKYGEHVGGTAPTLPERGISILRLGSDLYAFTVTDSHVDFRRLGPLQAVTDAVMALRANLANQCITVPLGASSHGRCLPGLATLTRFLVDPLMSLLDGHHEAEDRLVVVPDPHLADVPWFLLPGFDMWTVTVAPMLSIEAESPVDATTPARPTASNSVTSPASSIVAICGPGVANGFAEANAVTAHSTVSLVLAGEDATCERVLHEIERHDIAHLIGHGFFRDDNPLLSTVRLYDGDLVIATAHRLKRLPRVIVLSSCDLGRVGSGRNGHLVGLVSAFANRGCRSLIAAVAPVRDDEMAELMARFHRDLQAGVAADIALTRAQRSMRLEGALSTSLVVHLHVP